MVFLKASHVACLTGYFRLAVSFLRVIFIWPFNHVQIGIVVTETIDVP